MDNLKFTAQRASNVLKVTEKILDRCGEGTGLKKEFRQSVLLFIKPQKHQ